MAIQNAERNGLDFFKEAILECRFPENIEKTLLASALLKVNVHKLNREWELHFYLEEVIPEEIIKVLNCKLEKILKVPKIIFCPHYKLSEKKVLEILNILMPDIIARYKREKPSIAGWLSTAHWEFSNNKLNLFIRDEVGETFIKKNEIPQKLNVYLKKTLGLNIEVVLKTGVNAAENLQPEIVNYLTIPEKIRDKVAGVKKGDFISDDIVLGGRVLEQPISIAKISNEKEKVVIKGKVINSGGRQLNNGKLLYSFDLTDFNDTITVKFFNKKANLPFFEKKLREGTWLKVSGLTAWDRFENELVINAQDISICKEEERVDKAKLKRIELHLHTKMSAMDGLTDIKRLFRKMKKWGHSAVAVTDHGVVQAFPEAYEVAREYGIKIIFGMEGYLVDSLDSKAKKYHIIILARNQKGLFNLYKLVTDSHLKYYYRKPRILREELNKCREGLLLGSACEAGELIRKYLQGAPEEKLLEVASFYDYLEIQPLANNEFLIRNGSVNSREDIVQLNKTILKLGRKLKKIVVATGDVHFLDPEEAIFRKILLAGQGYTDEDSPPLYYRTTDEMLQEFSYLGDAEAQEIVVTGPNQISEQIEAIRPIPEKFYPPQITGAEEEIKNMCYKRARELYGTRLPEEVSRRLTRELDAIISNGFAVLYLIAYKIVNNSLQEGFPVGSRGSVGSSLVATLTGITEVNPLPPHYLCKKCKHTEFYYGEKYKCGADLPSKKCPLCGNPLQKDGHDIPFETFLGFQGNKVPDIDLNFSGEYQYRAHQFAEELFGKGQVFRAGTITTIAQRTSFGFVKNYFEEKNIKKRKAEISRLVKGCTGVKRSTGQHPGGLMIVPNNLNILDFTPLQYPADDKDSEVVTTHFDYHAISSRLVKLDILGHDDPTIIKMLHNLTGIDPRQIPLDEPHTMSLFSSIEALGVEEEEIGTSVGSLGIPEFGTRFVRQMLEETRPKTFSELVRISGLSHGSEVWINNAQELIKNGTACLSETISTRDDIMLFLVSKGMKSEEAFRIMEDVRKGRGICPETEQRMVKHGVPNWYIESCKKIKYMFPKAHAVAYVMMAFRIAYFKVYYPLEFYASFFTVKASDFEYETFIRGENAIDIRIKEIIQKGRECSPKEKNLLPILEVAREMYARKYEFIPVSLKKSSARCFIIENGKLLLPLSALEGVGLTAAQNIVLAREKKYFTSIEDLQTRAQLSKSVIEALDKQGCLKDLPETDQLELFKA